MSTTAPSEFEPKPKKFPCMILTFEWRLLTDRGWSLLLGLSAHNHISVPLLVAPKFSFLLVLLTRLMLVNDIIFQEHNTLQSFCDYITWNYLKLTHQSCAKEYVYLSFSKACGNMNHGDLFLVDYMLSCWIRRSSNSRHLPAHASFIDRVGLRFYRETKSL